jgi:uncharacterized YigZ family protein
MEDYFYTLKSTSTGLYKEKGSKFIALAFRVNTEEEAKDIIKEKKKEYHDARHVCFAYRVGTNNPVVRANDAGEPSNSAGKPILNQIQAKKVTNVLVVVARYFGGTLLGISGLINAYKTAASDALQNAELVKKYIQEVFLIMFPYDKINETMKIINHDAVTIFENEYLELCKIKIGINLSMVNEIIGLFEKINVLNIKKV